MSLLHLQMIHMITMQFFFYHIVALKSTTKKPFNTLRPSQSPILAPFCALKLCATSQKSCLAIQKKMPDDSKKVQTMQKKDARQLYSGSVLFCTANSQGFNWNLKKFSKNMHENIQGVF